jgi:hypothetical protein
VGGDRGLDPPAELADVGAWGGKDADGVHGAGMTGQAAGVGGGEEHRGLGDRPDAGRRNDTGDPVDAGHSTDGDPDPVADRHHRPLRQGRIQRDLAGSGRCHAGPQRVRRERGRRPVVPLRPGGFGDRLTISEHGGRERHLTHCLGHPGQRLDRVHQAGVDPDPPTSLAEPGSSSSSVGSALGSR